MRPSLTRRGRAVVVLAVGALVMGWVFGGRALNAVVMPAGALLAVTFVVTSRLSLPDVQRRIPDDGTAGESVEVKLDIDADKPIAVTVEDELDDGLEGAPEFRTVTAHETLRYTLHLRARGEHSLGPVQVTATDVFGLWSLSRSYSLRDTIIAFPRVYPLYESAQLLEGYLGLTDEREQFDSIREYERGDALRDVNWKHSAKVPDTLVVTEFAGEGATQTVVVGVDPTGARVDSAAEAAASVCNHLLEAGVAVGLLTPKGRLTPARGDPQRRQILTALARLDRDTLSVPKAGEADVLIRAPEDGSHVGIGVEGGMTRFGELVASGTEVESA
ncbi:MAG: DUF58 domain-containing protein [Halobacteriaceae archaeon]